VRSNTAVAPARRSRDGFIADINVLSMGFLEKLWKRGQKPDTVRLCPAWTEATMATKPIGFTVDIGDLQALDELVAQFGGDRDAFLHEAIRRMRHDLFAERMCDLQEDIRSDLRGRVVDRDEVAEVLRLADDA